MAMTGRSRVVVGVAAVLVAAVAVWWRASVAPSPPVAVEKPLVDAAPATETSPPPFVDIQGTHLAGADDAGRRLWELQAGSLQIDEARNTIVLIGVTGWLYRDEARQVHLAAPRATYLTDTRTVELSGGVAGAAPDGRTFSADRVRWTAGEQFTASGRIVLTQRGMTIHADQMRADAALEDVTFEGHVAITVVP